MPTLTSAADTRRDWTTSSLGERIQHICDIQGWTQKKLGEEAGIASGPMSKLIHKTAVLAASPDVLSRIADASGVSVLWLILGRGPVERVPLRHGMLRMHPEWPTALAEAKKRQRGIPNEFWNLAGDCVIHGAVLDWQLIVGLVREIYSAHQRGLETEPESPRRAKRSPAGIKVKSDTEED